LTYNSWDSIVTASVVGIGSLGKNGIVTGSNKPGGKPWFIIAYTSLADFFDHKNDLQNFILYKPGMYIPCLSICDTFVATHINNIELTVKDKEMIERTVTAYADYIENS